MHGHWKTWQASQVGRNRLHLIWKNYQRGGKSSYVHRQTFRFRHDLQFIDSRGSLLMRRAGSRSIPTWGLPDMMEQEREKKSEVVTSK
jgi:hypothetical protein